MIPIERHKLLGKTTEHTSIGVYTRNFLDVSPSVRQSNLHVEFEFGCAFSFKRSPEV